MANCEPQEAVGEMAHLWKVKARGEYENLVAIKKLMSTYGLCKPEYADESSMLVRSFSKTSEAI